MGDLYIDREVSEISSPVYHGDASNMSFSLDSLGFCSYVDDMFSHIFHLTSYICHRFIRFIEALVLQDVDRVAQDSVLNASEQYPRSSNQNNCKPVLEECSSPSSANASYGISARKFSGPKENLLVITNAEVIKTDHSKRGVPFIFQGLMLPLFGIQLAWRLTMASWRCTFDYVRCAHVQLCSIASRVQKTLRGSSDDIGWLQQTPGMAPVEDGTMRFLELLEDVKNGEHKLPDSFVYLLIPGLFSNHGPLYFVNTKRFFSKMGLACHIAKIHSEASVEHNAWELKHYIEELYWGSGKRVMLLGHSKGGVDCAAALSIYSSDLRDKVAGLALVQSPYGGTPIASDVLREGQIADKETRRIMELLLCKLIKGDIRALEDLTYEKRKEFIMKHKLPDEIPLVSFHSEQGLLLVFLLQ